MAAVVKSWVRIYCSTCKERRTFVLKKDWVLECSECRSQKTLAHGVLAR